MTFAASAASGFFLNSSEWGANGSFKSGNGTFLEHTLLSVATEAAIILDNSRRVEVMTATVSVL